MLSGVKFIPRNEIDAGKTGDLDASKRVESRKSSSRKENKSRRRRRRRRSVQHSTSSSEDESESDISLEKDAKARKNKHRKTTTKGRKWYSSDEHSSASDSTSSEEDAKPHSGNVDVVRREMGLEWMLTPGQRANKNVEDVNEDKFEEVPTEKKANPRELNPYLRDNGSGYPEDADNEKPKSDHLMSSSVVGDGGASWRLKALKRAEEQAAREGRNLKEVVQERWGSLGHLAVSVASRNAAAPRAHLHAIKSRKMGAPEEVKSDSDNQSRRDAEKEAGREYLKDVSARHPEMKAPKVHDSLSWGRRKGMHHKDAALISKAVLSLNQFANDGNFMKDFASQHEDADCGSQNVSTSKIKGTQELLSSSSGQKFSEEKRPLSANQLAAKAMQLRLKGKHEEAEKLMKEAENAKAEQEAGERLTKIRNDVTTSRYVARDISSRQKGKEDDSDLHLAQKIMKNSQYRASTQADDEYDYDGAPARKKKRKGAEHDSRSGGKQHLAKRIVTQQERCLFCFENPNRPKHLVVAIANFTYLMLPQHQPVAPGHCCIVTLQHESATRMVDDNVWEEIRNFKKCLIMMFAKQDREVIFLETVLWLAQQRRHCLIECIPLPKDIAKEAPLYFKKAIDEVEDEWSQHNAKKLIDTSQKGLRASIPKNFPYVHVEFGLNRGFVHVVDDEDTFKSSFGLNVIRGMLKVQDEDMYRRRRYESIETQKQAVAAFARDWEPFDWTKQLA